MIGFVTRYYTAAIHCYSIQGTSENEITQEQRDFDKSFHKWLIQEVVPLLHDGIWYPAFGGVYRILALQSTRGLEFPWRQDRGTSGVQGRCLAKTWESSESRTPWFFVGCILGFLVMFWLVFWVLLRLRKRQNLLRKTRGKVTFCDLDLVVQDWDKPESEEWDKPGASSDNQEIEGDADILEADAIISYTDECDTPHCDDMLEAIVESLIGVSSSASTPSKNHLVDGHSYRCLSENCLGENSLLSSTVLSQEQNRSKLQRHGSYSISGAAVVTQNPQKTPVHRSNETV